MPRYTQQEIKEFEAMKKNIDNKKKNGGVLQKEELDFYADVVVINKETRKLETVTVWTEIKNIQRLKNLIERVNNEYQSRKAIAVKHRSVGFDDIITLEQELEL